MQGNKASHSYSFDGNLESFLGAWVIDHADREFSISQILTKKPFFFLLSCIQLTGTETLFLLIIKENDELFRKFPGNSHFFRAMRLNQFI